MWRLLRVKQCHLHHPPVNTILIGGEFYPFPNGRFGFAVSPAIFIGCWFLLGTLLIGVSKYIFWMVYSGRTIPIKIRMITGHDYGHHHRSLARCVGAPWCISWISPPKTPARAPAVWRWEDAAPSRSWDPGSGLGLVNGPQQRYLYIWLGKMLGWSSIARIKIWKGQLQFKMLKWSLDILDGLKILDVTGHDNHDMLRRSLANKHLLVGGLDHFFVPYIGK